MTVRQESESPAGVETAGHANHTRKRDEILAPEPDEGKQLATLRAALALRGHEVFQLGDGTFLVSRWGHARACPDLHALAKFCRQIGGCA
jgi:hypothetical protein